MFSEMPNRIVVCYVDGEYFGCVVIPDLAHALWWARHLRHRWLLQPWIDREASVAMRTEA